MPDWDANASAYTAAILRQYGAEKVSDIVEQYPLARFGGFASSAFLQTNADKRLLCPVGPAQHTL